MAPADPVRAIFAEFAAIEPSNPAAMRQLAERWWAEDIVMVEDPRWPGASELRGREQVIARFNEYFETLEDARAELRAVHGEGSTRVLDFVFAGRGSVSGVDVEQRWAWVVEIRDGRLVSIRPFLDFGEAFAAAGIDPA